MVMQMIASEKQKEKKKGAKKLQAAQSAIMSDLDAKVGPQPSWRNERRDLTTILCM
jgi:hypothetical protein